MESSRRVFIKKSALGIAGVTIGEFGSGQGITMDPFIPEGYTGINTEWIRAADRERVQREGAWQEASFRYAEHDHLRSVTDGSSLLFTFEGVDALLRLGQHAVPAYGRPNNGSLAISIDNGPERIVYPLKEPREIVLARNLSRARHTIRFVHRATGSEPMVCIEALGYCTEPTGELEFSLTAENNAWFVDARAILKQEDKVIANRLVRNWLTGQCRLTGLPPGGGYRLEIHAMGWASFVAGNIAILPGTGTVLAPVCLESDPAHVNRSWLFPRIGRQAVRRPGESFRARFQALTHEIIGAFIAHHAGPATFSHTLMPEEDKDAAYGYDREFVMGIPVDAPPGLFDLTIHIRNPETGEEYDLHSPRSVMIVNNYPSDPVFMSWGHLDTQGQYQAEYLRDMGTIANLAGADMVLMACACNPAYIAGALSVLEIPYTVNFGNHQFPGFEQWFGPQENITDFGPGLCIYNRSLPWHENTAQADAMFSARPDTRIKVINAFEHNAPEELLDKHRVSLIHDGHGTGDRVMKMGKTPTQRVGKINAESFRMIRFKDGQVTSCTYQGDPIAPIPFPRGSAMPLRVSVDPPADGYNREITAIITNDLAETFPDCRVTVVMPAGNYACRGGRIESATTSDCRRFTRLTLRADAAASDRTTITVYKE